MRRSGPSCLLLLVFAVFAHADALSVRNKPLVVHEGASSVSALGYYQRLEHDAVASTDISAPAGASDLSMEGRLPLAPTRLKVGQPHMHTQAGQITPLFIMGMDAASLNWFSQAAAGLAELGARGVVVQADQLAKWHQLQQDAADLGIELMLLDGDSLAEGYGIATYPVVIVSPQLAGQGAHE